MRKVYVILLFLFFNLTGFGQDVITTTAGIAIEAKIEGISENNIRYKRDRDQEAFYSLPKSEIHVIKYEDGRQLFFNPLKPAPILPEKDLNLPTTRKEPNAPQPHNLSQKQLFTLGKADAAIHYKGYKTAGTFTLISTILFTPAGLVTALGTASTPPKTVNFTFPDAGLVHEPEYIRGYYSNARRIKSRKVWINFGAGVGTVLFASALLLSR